MQRRRPEDVIARHLRELGCSVEQVERHMLRGKQPPTIMRLRPRPHDWRSWENRIRSADPGYPARSALSNLGDRKLHRRSCAEACVRPACSTCKGGPLMHLRGGSLGAAANASEGV